jgi:hypothetical protein
MLLLVGLGRGVLFFLMRPFLANICPFSGPLGSRAPPEGRVLYSLFKISQSQILEIENITVSRHILKHLNSKIMGINIELVPSFTAIIASTHLRRLSTRCLNNAVGNCFHSATRALVKSGTDVEQRGLTHSQCSTSSQKWSMGLRSGLRAGQSSSSIQSTDHFCMDLALCAGVLLC